jgi:RNA polymerase sigma factor for flagellar operon FliA
MSITAAAQDERLLWQDYKMRGSAAAREELILNFAPLVKYVAGRLVMGLPPHVEVNDLVSYGIFGLLDAVEKYDHNRGVKFETYAVARIKGAILDGLRKWDWVPPSLRRRAREVEEAYTVVEQRLGRAASDDEVATALRVDLADFRELVSKLAQANLLSLDDLWRGPEREEPARPSHETIQDESADDPGALVEFEEKRRILAEAIGWLPEREKLVVTLYYYEGLTVKEISQILKVTPSRVSQLHSRAILRLRGRLAQHRDGLL